MRLDLHFLSLLNLSLIQSPSLVLSFTLPVTSSQVLKQNIFLNDMMHLDATSIQEIDADQLYNPDHRDEKYGTVTSMNVAQYLIDMHDNKGTYNFCGGMLFQLVLSDRLRAYLGDVASGITQVPQPVVFDSSKRRMYQIPEYNQSAKADNVSVFHGREVRKVPGATGGRGFVIHLTMADSNDPEGWTSAELDDYNGWEHDVRRTWRNGEQHELEGFPSYKEKFGPEAFGLHHRFYMHFDSANHMWLSAEDGCEGMPEPEKKGLAAFLDGMGF